MIISPGSLRVFALTSLTVAVFTASIDGSGDILTTVGSSTVLPSSSLPSSLVSETRALVLLAAVSYTHLTLPTILLV